ncbi:MAG: methylated-DNA--[protein]-cysteine S-methyltransferase [Dehalococcoidia bacterium]|nr:methylated-DNA--[protein]-cysteine S-methyltransferase [Dehalococcoidia bacterium]
MEPDERRYRIIASPLGPLLLAASAAGLERVAFVADARAGAACAERLAAGTAAAARRDPALAAAAAQLAQYFAGERTRFALPLAPSGTPFQRAVRAALVAVPHRATTSYDAVARAIGRPGAARAVGGALGRNPLAVVVPCHRVVGALGALRGYAGGVERKAWLLALERAGAAAGGGAPPWS